MVALIDGDWIVYRSCFTDKGKIDFIQTIDAVNFFLDYLVSLDRVSDYRLFLTGSTNFRYEVATIKEYKGHRPKEKPKYYHDVRDYMVRYWNAEISDGVEADDLCAFYQTDETIIIGCDKDLLTIPGWHYRIKKNWYDSHYLYVSPEEATYNFFKQWVVGDVSDNVPKIKGIGEAKVKKLLDGKSKEEMKESVKELYMKHYPDNWYSVMDEVARLLWIKRSPTDEYFYHV